MAKSKLEVKITNEIAKLEEEANKLYHLRMEALAKLDVLYTLLKED